ncbi:fumarylacetoacetate hydrolase family protein [Crocinitomix catalasitica]|uniref:fumarylacetoacetate hydrolase family protein n=1 Tax=Crocinitomix catalasitica TaxID=184607 RepID=UPI0004828E26|nr:fumarylacetoacetate hydrolase family protein [Crocinitomix catalasitica]
MKIICIGRNYSDHAKEMNASLPTSPLFFFKPDTAILKTRDFYYPEFTNDLHYEIELVVKISKVGKHITVENAPNYYNEIGLGIDFTARDIQQECKEKGLPWEKAKAFDNSAVLSATFLNKKNIDLNNINFGLALNGETVQSGNSCDMIFSIDYIISYISQFVTLKTGDLIYTGTPKGVGPVKIGDKLVGHLENKVCIELKIK